MLNFDLPAVQRLDDALSIQFLTSTTSVLHSHGLITAKEINNLRLTLSRINTSVSENTSVFLELDKCQDEIVAILRYRFGVSGLTLNLIRLSLQQGLRSLIERLGDTAEQLIKKSELVFNRSVSIYFAGKPQYKTLASTFVVDLAEQLVTTMAFLKESAERFGRMIPTLEPSSEDVGVDLEIAESIGFSGLTDKILPANEEKQLLRAIHQAMVNLAEYCTDFAEQVILNNRTEAGQNLLAASEVFKAESLRLAAIALPEGDSFVLWETRRRHLISNIASLTDALRSVCAACVQAVSFDSSNQTVISDRESLRNRLVLKMVGSGTPVAQAGKAAVDILSYLKNKNLSPSEVIPGELTRINSQLTVNCLELLQKDAAQTAAMVANTEMKTRVYDRSRVIFDKLKALMTTVSVLICFCPFVISCGFKTNPVNDAAEFRPDIPFKNAKESRPSYLIIPGEQSGPDTKTSPGKTAPSTNRGHDGNPSK